MLKRQTTQISWVHFARSRFCFISELPDVLRYLGQFPSEPQMQWALKGLMEDPNSDYLSYDKIEPYLVKVLETNEFPPASYESLLACFKRLDAKGVGYLKVELFKHMIKEQKK